MTSVYQILKLQEVHHPQVDLAYPRDVISIWKLQKLGLLISILGEVDHSMKIWAYLRDTKSFLKVQDVGLLILKL